jgi:hypothetical protein
MKKSIISSATAVMLALFTAALLPSCSTITANQQQDVRNLSAIAAAAAFAAADKEDRPKLAANLLAASVTIEALTGEGATAEEIRRIITGYAGKAEPEYVILGTVLADYVTRYTSGGDPSKVRATLHLVAEGIQLSTAAYAVPAK